MPPRIIIALVPLLWPSFLPGATTTIVVPNGMENSPGNSAAFFPFAIRDELTLRYQQVYAASQFSSIPPGRPYLTHLSFRPHCILNNGGVTLSNIQVNLSTTSRGPDQLSTTFTENVGSDDAVVFGPGSWGVGAAGGSCPAAFEDFLRLNVPFRYDPAQGNLLLDVRIYHPHAVGDPSNPERFAHDGIDALSDSVSRVYAWDVEAPVAARVDSDAIITEFAFMPTPSLTNALTTNAIVITWPSQPTAFSLEASDRLGAGANWQPYPTNQIGGGFLYRVITIPFQSMKREQYFRLVCEPCRPPP